MKAFCCVHFRASEPFFNDLNYAFRRSAVAERVYTLANRVGPRVYSIRLLQHAFKRIAGKSSDARLYCFRPFSILTKHEKRFTECRSLFLDPA